MKTVSARQANHEFSELLSRVERGEEVLITKRGKPVAVLCARDLVVRGMKAGENILLLQTLAEFSSVAIRRISEDHLGAFRRLCRG